MLVACLPALAPLFRLLLPSALGGNKRIVSANFPKRGAQQGDFTRLVESDATVQATAERGEKKKNSGTTAIELEERRRTPNNGARAEDLRAMQEGMNVLVHTEIVVTEEEKIADVIGI